MLSPLFVVSFATMVDQSLDSDYYWVEGSQQVLQKSWVHAASGFRRFKVGIPIFSRNLTPSVMKQSFVKCLEHNRVCQWAVPVASLSLYCTDPPSSQSFVLRKLTKAVAFSANSDTTTGNATSLHIDSLRITLILLKRIVILIS